MLIKVEIVSVKKKLSGYFSKKVVLVDQDGRNTVGFVHLGYHPIAGRVCWFTSKSRESYFDSFEEAVRSLLWWTQ